MFMTISRFYNRIIQIVLGLVVLVFLLRSASADSSRFNLSDRIETQKYYLSLYDVAFGADKDLTDKNQRELSVKQKTNQEVFSEKLESLDSRMKNHAKRMIDRFDSILPARIIMPLVYWQYFRPNQQNFAKVLQLHGLLRLMALRDAVDDPMIESAEVKADALGLIRAYLEDPYVNSQNLLSRARPKLVEISEEIADLGAYPYPGPFSFDRWNKNVAEAIKTSRLLSERYWVDHPEIADYSLSAFGFIPGNQVQLVSHNEVIPRRIKWFNDRLVFGDDNILDRFLNKIPGNQSSRSLSTKIYNYLNLPDRKMRERYLPDYLKMPRSEIADLFDRQQGETDEQFHRRLWNDYSDSLGHISFVQDDIYKRIRQMVDRSKDSIFIDIFLFGGTLGWTLANYIIEEAIVKHSQNPRFKFLLLHDYATNYNMKTEMMPVFELLKQASKKYPFIFLLQANIQRHPPGIPFNLTGMIEKPAKLPRSIENQNTYFESKIDHSKVIVIDAQTDRAEAFFGSKNWTDHSGGYYYDDAIWVKGPAAALAQASYFDDIDAALTLDLFERNWMFYRDHPDYQGYDNDRYLVGNRRQAILDWFKIKTKDYAEVGGQVVRLAEANVDGRIKNARNILVDMISKAESYIYMEQLFMYDSYINSALVKRLRQRPDLDVRILADHNGNFGFNGLPNTMGFRQMAQAGVKIRARKLLKAEAHFSIGGEPKEQHYHQENHRKLTVIDDKVVLGGSSNLNPDTLQGSFREFGAQYFGTTPQQKAEIARIAQGIKRDFENQDITEPFEVIEMPQSFQLNLFGKKVSPQASHLINAILSTIIRSKDDLEQRP